MRLQYQLASQDFVESAPLHSPNVVARFFYGLLAVQLAMILLGLAMGNLGKFHWQNFLGLLPQLLIWLGMIEVQKILYRRRLASAWEDDSHMSRSVIADVSATGIVFEEPYSTTNQPWDSFRQIKESKSLFLMFVSKRRFYMLPKRALADAGVSEAFRQLLIDYVPANKRKGII